jgi:hypothetical protein
VSLSKSECDVIAQALNEIMAGAYAHNGGVSAYLQWEEAIEDYVDGEDLRTYLPKEMGVGAYNAQELYAQVQERLALVRKVLCTGRCD